MKCAQPVAISTHSPIWRSVKIGRITFKAWINLAVVSVTASRKDSIIWTAIHNHPGISLGGKRLFRLSSMQLCQQSPQNQISQPEGSPPAGHHLNPQLTPYPAFSPAIKSHPWSLAISNARSRASRRVFSSPQISPIESPLALSRSPSMASLS
jgi:hypothetical protein